MIHHELVETFLLHTRALQRFLARRLRCAETAADLVQETFLRVAQLDPAQPIGNPRAFLFRIAANLATDWRRRTKGSAVVSPEETIPIDLEDPSPSAETMVFNKEQIAVLKQAIDELPPKCRQVFILHKFHHLSYAEVADRIGISRSTVVKHMIKALDHCKQRLEHA